MIAGKHSRGGIRDRFYITRDSDPNGTLSDTIDVWLTKPIRHRITAAGGYMWLPSDDETWRAANHGGAHWQQLTLAECTARFGTVPAGDACCLLLDEVTS